MTASTGTRSCWQGAPQAVLPAELTDDSGIPRHIDGVLVLAPGATG